MLRQPLFYQNLMAAKLVANLIGGVEHDRQKVCPIAVAYYSYLKVEVNFTSGMLGKKNYIINRIGTQSLTITQRFSLPHNAQLTLFIPSTSWDWRLSSGGAKVTGICYYGTRGYCLFIIFIHVFFYFFSNAPLFI